MMTYIEKLIKSILYKKSYQHLNISDRQNYDRYNTKPFDFPKSTLEENILKYNFDVSLVLPAESLKKWDNNKASLTKLVSEQCMTFKHFSHLKRPRGTEANRLT